MTIKSGSKILKSYKRAFNCIEVPKNVSLHSLLLVFSIFFFVENVSASTIIDFGIYAGQSLGIGGLASIQDSKEIGANNDITIGDSVSLQFGTINAGGTTTLGNSVLLGDVVTNQNFNAGELSSIGSLNAGGNADFGQSSLAESATVGGDIILNTNAFISQDASYGGTLSLSAGAAVGNDVGNANLPPLGFLATPLPASPTIVAGGLDQVDPGTLAPGVYGTLNTSTGATTHFSSGTYYFDMLDLGSSNNLELDMASGPITILIAGSTNIGDSLFLDLLGGISEDFYTELNDDFIMGAFGNWHGTIYSRSGSIQIGNDASLDASLFARNNITVGDGLSVQNFVLSNGFPPNRSAQAPAPGSMWLFLIAGFVLRLTKTRTLLRRASGKWHQT